jgi:hypothetical protein
MHGEPDSAAAWIETLELKPHPEGGHYAETYRSGVRVRSEATCPPLPGERCMATAIYYLLEAGSFSALHRLRSDELWHFYAGDALTLFVIGSDGAGCEVRLGRRAKAGETLQALVPAGNWFGARLAAPGGYALCGCTVSPGFEFADFEVGRRDDLLRRFPARRQWILSLTRE